MKFFGVFEEETEAGPYAYMYILGCNITGKLNHIYTDNRKHDVRLVADQWQDSSIQQDHQRKRKKKVSFGSLVLYMSC